MTILTKLAIMVISVGCLCTCGSGLPTEKDAVNKINKLNSKIPLEYTELKKTNGIKGKIEGKEIYEMAFTAKVIAKEDLQTFQRFKPAGVDTMYIAQSDSTMLKKAANMKGGFLSLVDVKPLKSFKKGELLFIRTGVINFVKTENGWE